MIAHLDIHHLVAGVWNQLPYRYSLRQPRKSCLDSPPHSLVMSSLSSSPLSASITSLLLYFGLKTYVLHHHISGISFLSHFASLLISLLHIHRSSCMTVHVHHHHFYPHQLLLFFTLGSKPIFSQVFPTVDFWYLTPGLPSRT